MSDPDLKGQLVDRLLGELSEDEGRDLLWEVAVDPRLALEYAELRCLFDNLQSLTVEPSSRVAVQVRNAVDRRVRLRQPVPVRFPIVTLYDGFKVAGVAAIVFVSALLGERYIWNAPIGGPETGDSETAVARIADSRDASPTAPLDDDGELVPSIRLEPRYLPRYRPLDESDTAPKPYRIFQMEESVEKRFAPPYARVEETLPHDVWLCATNTVSRLRQEFDVRFSPTLRRKAIRATGGSMFLAARIETMAGEIAAMIRGELDQGDPTIQDVALSLRALMAGGSTLRVGEHHDTVRRCSDWLLGRLSELHGGELATALSGLMDVAVVSGPKMGRLIGEHASRLTESIIYSNNEQRPSMLSWQTTPAQLADAGQVLRLTPAFGIVNKEALLARKHLATHLSEQIAWSTAERPDLLAALLFGFGDLVDCDELDLKLSLWHPRDLVQEHCVALHHIAWSRFPMRAGWADFQYELRSVSTIATPASCPDAAALLLTLAVSYAAPGSRELIEIAMR